MLSPEQRKNKSLGASSANAEGRAASLRPQPATRSSQGGITGAGFTPGPWLIKRPPASHFGAGRTFLDIDQEGGEQTIARLFPDRSNAEANARLISAAPELYEAGEALSNFAWGSCVQTDCEESSAYLQSLIDGLRAALSKAARGQS